MKLSNKEIKYIKKYQSRKSSEEIARTLKLNPAEVQKVVQEIGDKKPGKIVETGTDRWFFNAFLVFLFLAPLSYNDSLYNSADLTKRGVLQFGALLLITVWFFLQAKEKVINIKLHKVFFPIAAIIIWACISLLWSHDQYHGFLQAANWLGALFILFISMQIIESKDDIKKVLTALALSGAAMAILGIIQYLGDVNWPLHDMGKRPPSTFGNKNMAAHFAILALPASFGLIFISKDKVTQYLGVLSGVIITTFILYTRTRGAWVAVALEFIVLAILFILYYTKFKKSIRYSTYKVPIAISFFLILGLGLLPPGGANPSAPPILNTFMSIFHPEEGKFGDKGDVVIDKAGTKGGSSARIRLINWSNTLIMAKDNFPLGAGLNSFRSMYPKYMLMGTLDPSYNNMWIYHEYTHNDPINLLAELGLLFVVLLMYLLYLMIRSFWFQVKFSSTDLYVTMIISVVALAGFVANASFSFPLYRAVPPYIVAILLAVFFSLPRLNSQFPENLRAELSFPLRETPLKLFSYFFLAIFITWTYATSQLWKGDSFYKKQAISTLRTKGADIVFWGKKVRKTDPYRTDTLQLSGQGYFLLKNYKKARDYFEEFMIGFPGESYNLFQAAESHAKLAEFKRAEELLLKAQKVSPAEGRLNASLANIYLTTGQRNKAMKQFQLSVDKKPNNPMFQYLLGREYFNIAEYAKAEMPLRKTIQLNPKHAEAYKLLGVSLYKFLGKKEEGKKYMKKALELNPNITGANILKQFI